MSASIWGDGGLSPAQVGELVGTSYPPGMFGQMYSGVLSSVTAIPAADIIYLYPFSIYAPIVVTSIFERLITVGAGSAIKFAMWRNGSLGRPIGVPVLGQNAGLDTSASPGIKTSAAFSVPVNPGLYWFGTKTTGTPPIMLSGSATTGAVASRMAATTTNAIGGSTSQLTGVSAPDAYANDIMATDLTSATFSQVFAAGIPIAGLGWA